MEMAVPVKGKKEGQRKDGWTWRGKTWKELELRRETKSIGSNGKYFRTVATPNREKTKKEEEENTFICGNTTRTSTTLTVISEHYLLKLGPIYVLINK